MPDEADNRFSQYSMSSESAHELENHNPRGSYLNDLARTAQASSRRFTEMKNNILNLSGGQNEKSMKDRKVQEMAEIIEAHRPVEYMPIEKEEEVWVEKPWFDFVFAVVIMSNTVVIGLEVDLSDPDDRSWIWYVLENVFCVAFITEIVLKVYYLTWRWFFIDIFWNNFTVLICLLAMVDAWLLTPLGLHGSLRMLSLLRVVGLARLLRVIHQYRNLKELRLVMQGLLGAIGMLSWTVVLVFVFLYVSAVFVASTVGRNLDEYADYSAMTNGWDHEEWFGTVGRSMITLLQCMTRDSWSSQIARYIIDMQWHMAFFWLFFMLVTTYGLLNCVVSVIVEQTLSAAKSNENRMKTREERQRRNELEGLREIFMLADANGDGDLDLKEFMNAVSNPEILWRLRQLDLPIDDATRLFQVIDGDGNRTLTMTEFIEGCTKLKGPARSRDLLAISAQCDTLKDKMNMLGAQLQDGERTLATLDDITVRLCQRFDPSMKSSRNKIARNIGGSAPVDAKVAAEKNLRGGAGSNVNLGFGNRPILPKFPSLLN
mmetsp:Transcript_67256/g.119779  ORF Transcript_67256/g.119779 Transcript_67256/m.119779 type:complete len:544 (-) Transcript_67256:79-1710(-)